MGVWPREVGFLEENLALSLSGVNLACDKGINPLGVT